MEEQVRVRDPIIHPNTALSQTQQAEDLILADATPLALETLPCTGRVEAKRLDGDPSAMRVYGMRLPRGMIRQTGLWSPSEHAIRVLVRAVVPQHAQCRCQVLDRERGPSGMDHYGSGLG